ncbi:phage tail tape measure protein [Sphingobacterium sp. ML3W]|uniref:phage tail tape measure protein n=1 Tax=Sphingobacterium sp. ML3W TaxID=1538644 RepID=UPI00249BEDC7|nr:phage tail tape measure protein [Sphingobacterium sp. ML3W]WFA77282.1 phage tail tape measure protein [Sphingobacterium sp. ML3W]
MARQRTDTEAVIRLVIDGKQAQTSAKELQDTIRRLRTELNNMRREDNPAEYDRRVEELRRVREAWEAVRHEINGTTRETRSFRDEMKSLVADALGGLSITGIGYAIANGAKTFVQKNAEISDSYARVQKTTGLTEEAVDRLNDKFKKMDTRTANAELLGLAEVAGKLGISAEREVEGFVRAADKIGVALGEDLGGTEEAINSLGKLTDIFKLKDTFGIEDALIKVGSAINTLGASGTAAESELVDFANRLAGVAPAANISLPAVLGIASAQSELGQSMESASTAIGQFIVGIGSDIPRYAKIAGMSVSEFSSLLKNDANEALLRVLANAKSTGGGLEVMAKNMGVLEVSGSRGIAALSSMAENIDLVRKRQQEATSSFDEGTSIMDEFNTMNNTLGANLDKLSNRLSNAWQKSGMRSWLTDITAAMVDTRSGIDQLISSSRNQDKAFEDKGKELTKLTDRYDILKSQVSLNKAEESELKEIIQQISKVLPESVTEWNAYGEALDINRQKVYQMSLAEQELYNIRHKGEIDSLNGIFEAQKQYSEVMAKNAKDSQNRLNNSKEGGFLSLFGIDKKGVWKSEITEFTNRSKVASDDAYRAILELQKRGQKLTDEQEKYLYEIEKSRSVMLDPDLPGAKPATGKTLEGTKKTKSGKSDAEKEIDKAAEMYKKLVKASEDFGATQLLESLSQNEKELQAERDKYQKQIDAWEEFKSQKGASREQQVEADGRIALLEVERESSLSNLRLKQATDTNRKIEELNTGLANKHASELQKERDNINKFYDELEREAANDAAVLVKLKEDRAKALADAVVREESRIKDETKRLESETENSSSNRYDKKLEKIKTAYTSELEQLKAKFDAELLETEAFLQLKAALEAKYDIQRNNVEIDRQKERRGALLDIAQSTADAVAAIMSNNRQAELDAVLSNLDKQREKELSNKNLTENQKKAINDKYDKQVRAEKLRAWKADQKASIIQSVINTALAVTKALPNVWLAAAAAAAGLAQTAIIATQKPPQFAKGGFIPAGPSHAQGGINLVDRRNNLIANIEGGEPILSRDTYANNKDVVDALIYNSQRRNGASIGINSDAIIAEESTRRSSSGTVVVPPPVVNYSGAEKIDYNQFAKIIKGYVDDKISKIEVVQSYHLVQDHNQKIVNIQNSVDS